MQSTRNIIDRKLAEGRTLQQAAAQLEDEFRKAGWWGKRAADGAQLGSPRRIRTILRTNANIAYAAGRYQRQKATTDARPWWRYVAVMDGVTRLTHRQLHGKILKHDDPAWRAIYPPNGFNCRCRVVSMSDRQAKAAFAADPDARLKGGQPETRDVDMVNKRTGEVFTRSVTDVKLTDDTGLERWFAPDAGWGYPPGQWPFGKPSTPVRLRKGQENWQSFGFPEDLRAPEELPAAPNMLPDAGTLDDAHNAAILAVGVQNGMRRVTAPDGVEDVVIYADMLRHMVEDRKNRRERFANRIVPGIKDPDEVWLAEYENGEFRRHFLKAWDDKKASYIVAIESKDGNLFWTFMPRSRINNLRVGAPLYRRPGETSGGGNE